jgi:hypothetical protein
MGQQYLQGAVPLLLGEEPHRGGGDQDGHEPGDGRPVDVEFDAEHRPEGGFEREVEAVEEALGQQHQEQHDQDVARRLVEVSPQVLSGEGDQ